MRRQNRCIPRKQSRALFSSPTDHRLFFVSFPYALKLSNRFFRPIEWHSSSFRQYQNKVASVKRRNAFNYGICVNYSRCSLNLYINHTSALLLATALTTIPLGDDQNSISYCLTYELHICIAVAHYDVILDMHYLSASSNMVFRPFKGTLRHQEVNELYAFYINRNIRTAFFREILATVVLFEI